MVDLIPREVLFGNPERVSPNLSPDGSQLAWIAPRDGVLNVWVAPVGPGVLNGVHLDRDLSVQGLMAPGVFLRHRRVSAVVLGARGSRTGVRRKRSAGLAPAPPSGAVRRAVPGPSQLTEQPPTATNSKQLNSQLSGGSV